MSLRERFLAFDDALAEDGVPPLTEWWRGGIGQWLDVYERDHVLELFACVGRGAAKSTALYKLATFFTLFGDFAIPIGERHFAVCLSRLKEEAAKGIAIIDRWLTILGVAHRLSGDVIELIDLPRGIRVVAASVAASSGWRAFFVAKDERSKWAASGIEERDSAEIDTSASAMTATHPYAPIITAGSAWLEGGDFHTIVVGGTTPERVVLGPAATWVAAPHITRESCERKERDPRRFAREYACEFQGGVLDAFTPATVDACIVDLDGEPLGRPILAMDSSQGRGDAWTWCAAQWFRPSGREEPSHLRMTKTANRGLVREDLVTAEDVIEIGEVCPARDERGYPIPNPRAGYRPAPRLVVAGIQALEGQFASVMSADEVVRRVAEYARRVGARDIVGDSYQAFMIRAAFSKLGLEYHAINWTNESKGRGVLRVRQWFREKTIAIEPGAEALKLRAELLAFRERILPSGAITYGARAGAHDDRVALLLNLGIADTDSLVAGSPIDHGPPPPLPDYDPYSDDAVPNPTPEREPMQPTLTTATQLRDALAGVLSDPNDPRILALSAALATSDPAMLAAALDFVEGATPEELRATTAIKAKLVAEASALPPRFAVVVDVPAIPEGSLSHADLAGAVHAGAAARHAYVLAPAATAKGDPLGCRVIFPNGVSPAILEHLGRALRDLAPGLAASREPQRLALLSAAISTSKGT